MKNFFILVGVLNYIEGNICINISQEDIARECYSSLSCLQKLLRYAFHHSIKEYISKRRLTQASKDLVNTDKTIIQIAIKYQHNTPEVFTRAFSFQGTRYFCIHGAGTTKFKDKNIRYSDLFEEL